MSNPFAEAEAWVGSLRLGKGRHLVAIQSALSTMTKRGDKAMCVLELGNDDGSIKDWITLQVPSPHVKGSSIGIQQIAAVFDAAQVDRPGENEFDPETMKISQSALNRLAGKKVGIYVIDEQYEYRDDATGKTEQRTRSSVTGYIPAKDIVGGKVFGGTTASTAPVMGSAPAAADDDIPF